VWYIREVSTAVIVANIPLCFPLARQIQTVSVFKRVKQAYSNYLASSNQIETPKLLEQRGSTSTSGTMKTQQV
jgi:hypothetical protein